MTLTQQINDDLKRAMQARDASTTSVLRMLKSAVKYAAIEQVGADGELEDAGVLLVIRKQAKQREDAMEGFEKGGRPELAEKEKAELATLSAYLPKGLSAEELETLVRESIAQSGATSKAQMGLVMKVAQEKAAGRADGKSLSQEVQRQLA